MRWPWQRRRRAEPDQEEDRRALQARAEAALKLELAKATQPRVDHVMSRLEQIRRRNNFAAMLEAALRERRT